MNRLVYLALCVLYVLSPVDLVPEALLGPFGLADDAIVVLMGIRKLLQGNGHGP